MAGFEENSILCHFVDNLGGKDFAADQKLLQNETTFRAAMSKCLGVKQTSWVSL